MDYFHTSCCKPLNLAIDVAGRGLDFSSLPKERAFDRCLVRLVERGGREAAVGFIRQLGNHRLPTGLVQDGDYYLQVFTGTSQVDRYRGFVQDEEVPVRIVRGIPSFQEPRFYRNNLIVLRRLARNARNTGRMLRAERAYPCDHPEIRSLAASITYGLDDEYGKLLAVHDWVAENIFYDYDSLRRLNGRLVALERSTLDVLRTRRGVCQGYSDLAVSLLRACGIPSESVQCFALGQGTTGGWERPENQVNRVNHAFTAALIRGRYVLMDITWDSDNVYSQGRYARVTGQGKMRKYFDVSPLLFSVGHRMIR